MYRVYSDGACRKNPGPASWGVVVITPDGIETTHSGYLGTATNQIAELSAAIEGISRTPEGVAVELISDSQYVLKGIGEWRKGWERNGMKNSKGDTVANLGLWKLLWSHTDARKVKTTWVKGHSGDHYNELCDALAGQEIAKYS